MENKSRRFLTNIWVLFFSLSLYSFQTTETYKVVKVLDGDTIEILSGGNVTTRIRLASIDCPEKSQAFGNKAKEECSNLCFAKQVTVRETGKDKYGRTLAFVYLQDGTEVNREMVRLGYAWHYRKYSSDQTLEELETKAREQKIGLWADAHPEAPWEYRKRQREENR